jgi:hypothetical protein
MSMTNLPPCPIFSSIDPLARDLIQAIKLDQGVPIDDAVHESYIDPYIQHLDKLIICLNGEMHPP